ncbi:hypothetical protein LR48_Vigan08g022800 [Vigna angularis]|uniref:Uncharacterized protein n=1 Tax=Phaseolus angularis TaxID=3914 RepID=A0A0L9V353_PHAAN|nr:hypothetical protein LR48_Vigan08g022800 [Vigna angularis]
MTGEGSKRRDKGKRVARPKRSQRQAPKYVLRVLATLPTTAAPSPSFVGPPPTPVVHPPPTPAVDPPPTPAVDPPPTLAADPLPPLVIITPTPPPMIITHVPPPDPTSIPSSSYIPPSETATPFVHPDSAGDGDGVDLPLHDRPWIEPYGKGSEHGSAPTPDDASYEDDDIRRTQCWVDVVGGKKKGRVYDVRQLAANYTTSRGENYSDLRNEFTNFKSLVMRVLPDASDIHSTVPPTQPRPSPSPVIPQQPTSVQPTSVQPTPVQPTPVQSSIE